MRLSEGSQNQNIIGLKHKLITHKLLYCTSWEHFYIGMSATKINSMATTASMSGPLSLLGALTILASLVLATKYYQDRNAKQSVLYYKYYDYSRPHIKKRSSLDIDSDAMVSLFNSYW